MATKLGAVDYSGRWVKNVKACFTDTDVQMHHYKVKPWREVTTRSSCSGDKDSLPISVLAGRELGNESAFKRLRPRDLTYNCS